MFNPLVLLDWLSASADHIRSAQESPHVPQRYAAEAETPSQPQHWLLWPWVMVVWSLALLLAIILLTHYVGMGAAALAGGGAVLAVILFGADGEYEWLPPAAARQQSVGAGAHLPGEARTGDAVADAFLDRLAALTPAEWSRVPRSRISWAASLYREVAVRRAYARLQALVAARGLQPQCDAIARGVRAALAQDERLAAAGFWGASFARMAATALLLRGELTEAEVRVLYSAFERLIPRASLTPAVGAEKTRLIVAAHESVIEEHHEVFRDLAR